MGAAVAGPFAIEQPALDALITPRARRGGPPGPVVH